VFVHYNCVFHVINFWFLYLENTSAKQKLCITKCNPNVIPIFFLFENINKLQSYRLFAISSVLLCHLHGFLHTLRARSNFGTIFGLKYIFSWVCPLVDSIRLTYIVYEPLVCSTGRNATTVRKWTFYTIYAILL